MRLNLGLKTLSIFTALLLVAACETAPTETGDSSGGGATTQTSGTSGSSTTVVSGTTTTTVKPGSQEDLVLNVGDRVFFGFDKYDLSNEAQATLQRQAAWLKANPTVTLVIEGNTDERGTREYNLALGERRATAVKNYLVTLGISADRLSTISYGKERPVALGHNEAAWAQNRRSVSVVN
ncbi:peptidoglycan-associated lipoprotein Pal [Sneathiella sp. CAU 1612]|jgi:peptidoglycan-associated lipoprotein|uniref:Peptidoglycan-associated lipoprotein n=1 Tax=Sneathiella sedimenti TaxID=2816034 RepID=A0ABS3F4I7_9PROT|nr:peptidoglycan-associated lipoprotein Pal [Sneathiella sedimenti]MBO0333425.1 peptidoglycan-associated lipoprotein Pal [Sneathiella sedimenti]